VSAFWRPLESALGASHSIYVSPDGVLNLVSLGLIPSSDGKLLLEKHDLHVLTSTKDLLRQAPGTSSDSAVLVGNPRFNLTAEEQRAALLQVGRETAAPVLVASVNPSSALRKSREGGALDPLPGTAVELEAVRTLLEQKKWQVRVYADSAALEEAVKRARSPRLLHLATHGFFLGEQAYAGDAAADVNPGLENPMMRSGLFFAGAERALLGSRPPEGLEDGVLTAYEAAALDLQGTDLVVLSACETGLGQVRNGEGVFGLRRALQIAGARAVLMSLWAVPDRETQELMGLFYEKWLAGAENHDALRAAQLEMRERVRARYGKDLPHYWGGFILVGP
jgi:CHAT domain-containing protein